MTIRELQPLSIAMVACLALAGCQASSKSDTTVAPGTVGLCTQCGQIEGSDQCCRPGAATCPKCGLHKGSPGCCKMPLDG